MANTLQQHGGGKGADGDGLPQPIQGNLLGATILGPHNVPLERENPDLLASPQTATAPFPTSSSPFPLHAIASSPAAGRAR